MDKLLCSNVVNCLTASLLLKDEQTFKPAKEALDALKEIVIGEDTTAETQAKIVEQLLQASALAPFDNLTGSGVCSFIFFK